jgi:hypothetical protein
VSLLPELVSDGLPDASGRHADARTVWRFPSETNCGLGASATLAHLRLALATELVRCKLDDLDAGDIRTRVPREFTQSVSRYVFEAGQHAGIRYRSRLGDELINWAIFEPNEPAVRRHADNILGDDPDFLADVEQHHLELVTT